MQKEHKSIFLAAIDKFGSSEARVGGWSMWPFIRDNDVVRIVKGAAAPYLGKVAAFFNGDQLVAHRIIWAHKGRDGSLKLWVQGDFIPGSIAAVEENNLVGIISGIQNSGFLRKIWLFQPFCALAIVFSYVMRLIFFNSGSCKK